MGKGSKNLPENVSAYLAACKEVTDEVVFKFLAKLGLECVNRIRNRSKEESWNDQTGNLRSSIGYLVTRDGQILTQGGFEPTDAPKGNGAQGQKDGENYATGLVGALSRSRMVLIVVAGMEYAVYVEARDNKDVLASTQLWAEKQVEQEMKNLEKTLQKRWDALAKKFNL